MQLSALRAAAVRLPAPTVCRTHAQCAPACVRNPASRHHFSTPDAQLLDTVQDERHRLLNDMDALLLELVLQVTAKASVGAPALTVVQAMVTQEFSSRSVLFAPRARSALAVAADASAASAAAAAAAAACPSSRLRSKSSLSRTFSAGAHALVAAARLQKGLPGGGKGDTSRSAAPSSTAALAQPTRKPLATASPAAQGQVKGRAAPPPPPPRM